MEMNEDNILVECPIKDPEICPIFPTNFTRKTYTQNRFINTRTIELKITSRAAPHVQTINLIRLLLLQVFNQCGNFTDHMKFKRGRNKKLSIFEVKAAILSILSMQK